MFSDLLDSWRLAEGAGLMSQLLNPAWSSTRNEAPLLIIVVSSGGPPGQVLCESLTFLFCPVLLSSPVSTLHYKRRPSLSLRNKSEGD